MKFADKSTVARRSFLKAAGLGTAALPFVALPGQPRAATAFPKRLVIVTSSNGTSMPDFWPTVEAGAPLAKSVTGSRILEPLAAFAQKLVVMRGIDSESAHKPPIPPDHDPDFRNLLTGRQPVLLGTSYVMTGISIDQHIANAIGRDTKFASLHVGGGSTLHSRGYNLPIPAQSDPKAAVQSLFGDLLVNDAQLVTQRLQRTTVLDLLNDRMRKVRSKLGAEDQSKVDAHMGALEDLRLRAQIAFPKSCKAPTVSAVTYPERVRSYVDLTVAALACDACRVATIDLDNGGVSHSFIDFPGVNVPYHGGIAHDGSVAGFKKVAEVERWVASQFAYLLGKMDSVVEGDGTLLDHSLVLWMKEQSNGSTHSRRDYPVVLAGGANGAIKTGRILHANGKPHSGLLISIANAMGVPTETFGDSEFSHGPLSGL